MKQRRSHPEEDMHEEFFQTICYMKKIQPYVFKIEHGVKLSNPITAARLKRQGLKAGIADYMYVKKNSKGQMLWVEFKAGKNKQQSSQVEFERIVTECNDLYVVCYNAQTAIDILVKHT